MKYLIWIFLCASAWAQTAVTATVVDPNGNPYANGTASAYTLTPSGQPFTTTTPVATSAAGAFSMSLPANTYIFTVCSVPTLLSPPSGTIPGTNPTPRQICFASTPIAITGATQDISNLLNPLAPVLGPRLGSGSTGSANVPILQLTNSPNCTIINEIAEVDNANLDLNGVATARTATVGSKKPIGIVVAGAGCTGIATIATTITAFCVTDNLSHVGEFVMPSAVTPGNCTDYGAVQDPTVKTIGEVLQANSAPGGLSTVVFNLGDLVGNGPAGTGIVSSCTATNCIAYYPVANTPNVNGDTHARTDGNGNGVFDSSLTVNDINHAGYWNLLFGNAPPNPPAGGVQLTVPTSGTGFRLLLPGTAPVTGDCAKFVAVTGGIQVQDAGFPCGSGAGNVTSFSSGNLSPLFTTSVATPTSTPALSFSLSNAAAHTYFGNNTGSTAAPAFVAIAGSDLPAQYIKLRCETGLGDGLNVMSAGTYLQSFCYNDSGVTWTLNGLKCFTDNAGTSTMNATNGAGTALLTGAVTCTSSFAAGTQSGTTTIANGDYIKFTFVADGTSKQTTWVVSMTQ